MRRYWFLLFLITVTIGACSSPAPDSSQKQQTDTVTVKNETTDSAKETKTQPVLFHIDSLFDRQEFKRAQSSSHSSAVTGLPYLFQHDSNGFYQYFYFLKQRNLMRHTGRKLIEKKDFHMITAVKKPLNGNEQYLEVEETLVQLQSTINDPLLGSMNLVNQDTLSVNTVFGAPTYRLDDFHIHGNTQHILVIQHEKGRVRSFKYMYLKESITSILDQKESLRKGQILSFVGNY